MADDHKSNYDGPDVRIVTAKKSAHIPAEMNNLSRTNEELFKTLQELETKLSPIMRGPTPEVEEGHKEEEYLVELAGSIRDERRTAAKSLRIVNNILNQIEL